MKKYKFFWDFDKEENWLNQMAKEGWELKGKSMGYEFRKAAPKDTIIKIDFRIFKTRDAFEDYRTLFRDSGWEHIAGSKSSGNQYFKRISADGEDEIFSDIPSKAARYKKFSSMSLNMAISYIPIFVAPYTTKAINITTLLNPKLLYYTPGLWEKSGFSFWRAFLFETPFAMMRGFLWLFFPAFIILHLVFAAKAELKYREACR